MKAPIRVLTPLVLCVILIAGSVFISRGEAESGSPVQTSTIPAVASNVAGPVRPEWRLGSPLKHNNLTVFPVLADAPTTGSDHITLDEGLRSGKVIITELGADGRSRRINRRQISDDAEVNRLSLTNKSGKPLLLLAGEMIVGGQQDRIVGHDCIIEASNTPVPLDVFCVEHGRWSGGSSFGQGIGPGDGGRGSGFNLGGGNAALVSVMAGLAAPNIREKAQASKSQGEVWNAVEETVTVTATASRTGNLTSVYQNKRVNTKLVGYQRALKGRLSARNIVGVVVAVGDKIISADVFANHSLFRAYWPKMLKSFALEAVGTTSDRSKLASKTEAEAFLARVQGDSTEKGDAAYRLAENQSSAHASFELEDVRKTPTLVHFNRVAKQ